MSRPSLVCVKNVIFVEIDRSLIVIDQFHILDKSHTRQKLTELMKKLLVLALLGFSLSAHASFTFDLTILEPTCSYLCDAQLIVESTAADLQLSLDNSDFQDELIISDLCPGEYTLYLKDDDGCTAQEEVLILAPFTFIIDLGPDIEAEAFDEVPLEVLSNVAPSSIVEISWMPETGLSCTDCSTPVAELNETVTYTVTLTSANGCIATDEITVFVGDAEVFIPNAFSPNFDGYNDFFNVFVGDERIIVRRMQIADNWGNVVYDERNFNPSLEVWGWDGSFRGKMMQPNVFIYFIELGFPDGSIEQFHGDVTLIR